MSKIKEVRKRTLLERLAFEKSQAEVREKALIGAIGRLRVPMLDFAKGENWAARSSHHFWQRMKTDYIWAGVGNPQDRAEKAMVEVFGKDYLRAEEEHREGK